SVVRYLLYFARNNGQRTNDKDCFRTRGRPPPLLNIFSHGPHHGNTRQSYEKTQAVAQASCLPDKGRHDACSTRYPRMLDAVMLSDLHLGSDNCQAHSLCELLEVIKDEVLPTTRLILNGDVFDSIDFRRLNKSHWKVLSLIRKLSHRLEIVWICGNHDG